MIQLFIDSSEKYIEVRKALAWRALNDMNKVWSSNMSSDLKRKFFGACTLYLNKSNGEQLNGTFTRMPVNVYWSNKITNKELY